MGPAFGGLRKDATLQLLHRLTDDSGFRGTITPDTVWRRWERSWGRWLALREEARQRHRERSGGEDRVMPPQVTMERAL
jgi:hypothetical protein